MMTFKKSTNLLIVMLLPLVVWGCFEDHASKFHLDDANQVEWKPANTAAGATPAGYSYTLNLDANQTETETVTFTVQLIGAQTGADRSVGVAVSDTDAQEGVHFELASSEVVIPANSNAGEVHVIILAENIGNGDSYSATLELQPGSELDVAVNMKDMNLTIQKAAE